MLGFPNDTPLGTDYVKVCTSVLMNTQAGYIPDHPGENHVSLIVHVKLNHNLRLTQHTSVDYLFHLPIQDQTIVVIGINKTEYIDPTKNLEFTYPRNDEICETGYISPNNSTFIQLVNKQSFFQHLQEHSRSDLIVSMTKDPADTEVNAIISDKNRHINYHEITNVPSESKSKVESPSRKSKQTVVA